MMNEFNRNKMNKQAQTEISLRHLPPVVLPVLGPSVAPGACWLSAS
jgi:hypothetical protein